MTVRSHDLPVHFPTDPQQQNAAGQRQSDDGEKLLRYRRKGDAEDHRAGDAPEDDLGSHLRRHPRSGETDDDRIVAGQDDVDQDDIEQANRIRLKPLDHFWPFSASGWTLKLHRQRVRGTVSIVSRKPGTSGTSRRAVTVRIAIAAGAFERA